MHKFKLEIDNLHRFVVQDDSLHKFILKSYEATPVLKTDLDKIEYTSTSSLGSREIPLMEFDCMLNQLPNFRQFVGRYTYILVRTRCDISQYNYEENHVSVDVGVRASGGVNYLHNSSTTNDILVRSSGVISYDMSSAIDYCIAMRLLMDSNNTDYMTNANFDTGVKVKSDSIYVNDTSIINDISVRVKSDVNTSYSTTIDESKVYQFTCRDLNEFSGLLSVLPTNLKDFCYIAV